MASDGGNWLGFVGIYAVANILLVLFSATFVSGTLSSIDVLWLFTWCGPPFLLFMVGLVAYVDGLKWYYWMVSVLLACGAFVVNLAFMHDAIAAV